MKNYGNKGCIELKKDGAHYTIFPCRKSWFMDKHEWDVYRVENDDWVFCGIIRNKTKRLSYKRMWELIHTTL